MNEIAIAELIKSAGLHRFLAQVQSDPDAKAEMLVAALKMLLPHINEVSDKQYRLLFAVLIQQLQDIGKFNVGDGLISRKLNTFTDLINEYDEYEMGKSDYGLGTEEEYIKLLLSMYASLGFIYLNGKELDKDDDVAYCMFGMGADLAEKAGMSGSKQNFLEFMDKFAKGTDGNYVFIG